MAPRPPEPLSLAAEGLTLARPCQASDGLTLARPCQASDALLARRRPGAA